MKSSRHTIAVIDPSELLQEGIRSIFTEFSEFTIESISSGLPLVEQQGIDIVLINPTVILRAGRGRIRELYPEAKIIALIYNYIDRNTRAMFDAIIEIDDPREKILETIESLSQDRETKGDSNAEGLSERELEILVAVAKGMTSKEVANEYNISVHTVIAHRKNISRKTGIRSVSGFLVYALLNNLIEESEVLK